MRTATVNHRRALTLFSLLVLMGISGLLMAMFFPAVLKVRDTARRMGCQNNLKQLGLGMHSYHDTHNFFPGVGQGDPDHKKEGTGSWCFRLLPYLEQDNVYQLDGGPVPVATLICMQRRPVGLYDGKSKTDYAGNAGTALDPEKPEKPEKEDGIFTKKGIRIADVLDGTSNTLMIGEKGLKTTEYLTGKGAGDKNSCWVGALGDALRSSNEDKRPPAKDVADEDHDRGFGAMHDKACNFGFCDGSVRSISYSIKGSVFQALCTRNGGEVVNPNDF